MKKTTKLHKEEDVLLPQTEQELDEFVSSLSEQFGFPNNDHTYEAIAAAIMQLPGIHAFAPRSYFGNAALRQLAKEAAYAKLSAFNEKRKAADAEAKAKAKQEQAEAVSGQPV